MATNDSVDLSTIPAYPPPDGVTPDFNAGTTRVMADVIVAAVFVLLATTAFVGTRAGIRARIYHKHYVEDWLCYVSFIFLVAFAAVLIHVADLGLARNRWDITAATFMGVTYYMNVLSCLYCFMTLAAKASVLLQIKRIFNTRRRDAVHWVVMVSMAFNVVFYTAFFFVAVFQCWPRDAIWDPRIKGTCIGSSSTSGGSSNEIDSASSSYIASGALNLFSDIEALLLPAWAIFHLKMPIRRKLEAYTVFAFGLAACIISAVGIYLRVLSYHTFYATEVAIDVEILIIAETAVVIIVGCIPSLPRLVQYIRGNRASSKPSSQGYSEHSRRHEPSAYLLPMDKIRAFGHNKQTSLSISQSSPYPASPSFVTSDDQVELSPYAARVEMGGVGGIS
ncbi:hypothetical protein F5Y15DRAFT_101395 [Xylariaceae sp. FL0016]|nr:hypothetical protein F5Y15DRAFT_101395 [Xylariaceae sp. FL0016]